MDNTPEKVENQADEHNTPGEAEDTAGGDGDSKYHLGKIQFHSRTGSCPLRAAHFARVGCEAKMESTWKALSKEWQLPIRPELLILVTGGSWQQERISSTLQDVIRRGLFNLARTFGIDTWVVTEGVTTPLVNLVGEAIQYCEDRYQGISSYARRKGVALGIAPLQDVADLHFFQQDEGKKLHHVEAGGQGGQDAERSDCRLPLNCRLTHFLLVEDKNDKRGKAEKFKADFRAHLAEVKDGLPYTMMMVVAGGGETVKEITQGLEKDYAILVISGTGGVADRLSQELDQSRSSQHSPSSLAMGDTPQVQGDIQGDDWGDADIDDLLAKCRAKKHLIHFFDMEQQESTEKADKVFFFTLLRCALSTRPLSDQLDSAVKWKCLDFVKDHLSPGSDNVQKWQYEDAKKTSMRRALVDLKEEFVQLFLDLDIDLHRFLSLKNLWKLFEESLVRDNASRLLLHRVEVAMDTGKNVTRNSSRVMPAAGKNYGDTSANRQDLNSLHNFARSVDIKVERLLNDSRFRFFTVVLSYEETTAFALELGIFSAAEELRRMILDTQIRNSGSTRLQVQHSTTELFWPPDIIKARSKIATGYFDTSKEDLEELSKENGFWNCAQRGLFIWALLFQRHDLAYLFWKNGQDQLGSALFASCLLLRLSQRVEGKHLMHLRRKLERRAEIWEKRAVDLLNLCYKMNRRLTHKLLLRPLPYWGFPFPQDHVPPCCGSPCTCHQADPMHYWPNLLDLACHFQALEFVAHSACQTKIADHWYEHLPVGFARWKILALIVFPFYPARRDIKAKDNDEDKDEDTDKNEDKDKEMDPDERFSQPLSVQVKDESCSYLLGICNFYSAPVTKFITNCLSYVVFLILFSAYVVMDLKEGLQFSWVEIVFHVWMVALIVEDLSQIRTQRQPFRKRRLFVWFHTQWKFDLGMYVGYVLSLFLRLSIPDSYTFKWTRAFFAITIILAFQSFMQFFLLWKGIGPKVNMVERMWTDFSRLMRVCLVILMSFGIAFAALMHPGSELTDPYTYFQIVYYPYFQIYGELFLDRFMVLTSGGSVLNSQGWTSSSSSPACGASSRSQGPDTFSVWFSGGTLPQHYRLPIVAKTGVFASNLSEPAEGCEPRDVLPSNCTHSDGNPTFHGSTNETTPAFSLPCPDSHVLLPFLLCIYLALANIMMINLVIAQMTNTFEEIQNILKNMWSYQLLTMTKEYCFRPTLAPPLSLINIAWRLLRYRRWSCKPDADTEMTSEELQRLIWFERLTTERYFAGFSKDDAIGLDQRGKLEARGLGYNRQKHLQENAVKGK